MGKYEHPTGAIGGGKNLSNAKTPRDKDIKDMPLFKMGKPYEMGMSMRGPLDKHGKVVTNSWEEEDVKRGRKEMAEGHKGHAEALFDDAHGSWNWSKSHHSTGAEMTGPLKGNAFGHAMQKAGGDYDKAKAMLKMTGPLNQKTYQQSSFEAVSEEEFKKRQAKRNAKQGAAEGSNEAAAEGAGELGKNQKLKTNVERKITLRK